MMSAAELVTELRRIGREPSLDGRGKFTVAAGPALPEELEEAVRQQRYEVLALLRAEAGIKPPDPELASLVEMVGRQQQWLVEHAEEWSDEEWEKRRDALLANLARMEARLVECGQRMEEYGWVVNPRGIWRRVGEPDTSPEPVSGTDEPIIQADDDPTGSLFDEADLAAAGPRGAAW